MRPELTWPGKSPYVPRESCAPELTDAHDGPGTPLPDFRSRLLRGDNLRVMDALLPEFAGRIDLIYVDPPFNARRDFTMCVPLGEGNGVGAARDRVVEALAYSDTWPDDATYLQMLYERLLLMRELLAPTGSILVHVNWRVGHLVQALLDEVFGRGEREAPGKAGFRNEIVWGFGGGGAVKTAYRRKHDNLYWYTRSDRWTFHAQRRPYTPKTRQRGLTAVKGPEYTLHEEGAALETWWTDSSVQKILSPTAYENLKFPTQKPEALLERIVLGHTDPGALVADFFCGSGTTGAVAERLGRRWIMADQSPVAVHTARKRLAQMQVDLAAASRGYRAFDVLQRAEASEGPGDPERQKGGFRGESVQSAPSESADLRVECHGDGTVVIRLLDYRAEHARTPRGLEFLDYWAVDFEQGARTECFRHGWASFRTPRDRTLQLTSPRLPLEGDTVRVKLIDALGGESVLHFRSCS